MALVPKLSKEMIINTAFEYADIHGLEDLSMRNLARELDVKAMSLYNHIKNKDELFDLLVERLVAEFVIPDETTPWEEAMTKRAISMHHVLMRHRWGTKPLVSRRNIGPVFLRFFDRSLANLKAAGFTNEEADRILVSINGYVYGFTLAQLNFPLQEEDYVSEAIQHDFLFPKDIYPALHDLSKDIQEQRYSGFADFELGLQFMLRGIEFYYKK